VKAWLVHWQRPTAAMPTTSNSSSIERQLLLPAVRPMAVSQVRARSATPSAGPATRGVGCWCLHRASPAAVASRTLILILLITLKQRAEKGVRLQGGRRLLNPDKEEWLGGALLLPSFDAIGRH
jgi:hypothetical protein